MSDAISRAEYLDLDRRIEHAKSVGIPRKGRLLGYGRETGRAGHPIPPRKSSGPWRLR
ncbi:hypothetical protein [Rhizobium mongolense]|uniref:Uncharacterized protein n=1 Tax=Rhizobium mongolense TaxID=57676 RepID=A0ABR6IU44_9HYPH|nr:hypothetical protein [Rhizobium mongolense]MBB4231431.1 hypothetical protein [Rhizobium mongolense]